MARRTTEITFGSAVPEVWSALWDETAWVRATAAVEAVDLIDPGDRHGNGRIRRIHQHRTFWDPTLMMERTERVAHHRSVEAKVHHHRADLRHGWRIDLVATGPSSTIVTLDEVVEVDEARWPGETRWLTRRLLTLRPRLLEALARPAA
jgi:hypothetical protein